MGITFAEISRAVQRIRGEANTTPLVPSPVWSVPAGRAIPV